MSVAPGLVRPAARSAAVRPHSASSSSPWPASAASPWRASLFFAPITPALWQRLIWLAASYRGVGRGEVVTVTPLVTPLVTPKPLQLLHIPKPLPRYHSSPAHVIRSRARTCAILSLPLVTWEQDEIVYVVQGVEPFPRPLPALAPVGTWEQAQGSARLSDRLPAAANKVEGGYAFLRLAGGGARQKFRAAIARLGAAAEVELGRIQQLATRRCGNGGNPPFFALRAGHVGRAMLEGSTQEPEFASFPALRLKLGRLRHLALAELAAGAIERPAAAAPGVVAAERHPGTPNRPRASRAVRPLHAGRIWIEDRAQGAVSRDDYSNRPLRSEKNSQTGSRQRGPGGARLWNATDFAIGSRNREAEKRAGVSIPSAMSLRSHETGEATKLRRQFGAVNGLAA